MSDETVCAECGGSLADQHWYFGDREGHANDSIISASMVRANGICSNAFESRGIDLDGGDFCSIACFRRRTSRWLDALEAESAAADPLPGPTRNPTVISFQWRPYAKWIGSIRDQPYRTTYEYLPPRWPGPLAVAISIFATLCLILGAALWLASR